MIKGFWMMSIFLLLMLVAVGIHYCSIDRDKAISELGSITSLVGFVEPSLGVSWYESRTLHLQHSSISNGIYPEMDSISRMDFVYEK